MGTDEGTWPSARPQSHHGRTSLARRRRPVSGGAASNRIEGRIHAQEAPREHALPRSFLLDLPLHDPSISRLHASSQDTMAPHHGRGPPRCPLEPAGLGEGGEVARALRACTGLPVQAEDGGCGRTSWLHSEPVGPSRWQFAMPLGPPHVCCSPSTWRVHTMSLLRTKRPVQRELSTGRAALGGRHGHSAHQARSAGTALRSFQSHS